MDNTITLKKNGQIRTMSRKSYNLLKGRLDGYIIVENQNIYASTNKQGSSIPSQVKEITREEMVESLKEKGINVHHKLGDAKLKERYELEIKSNQ